MYTHAQTQFYPVAYLLISACNLIILNIAPLSDSLMRHQSIQLFLKLSEISDGSLVILAMTPNAHNLFCINVSKSQSADLAIMYAVPFREA